MLLVRMQTRGAERGKEVGRCPRVTRAHTAGLGTACGTECERACLAVSARVSECVICMSASAIVWGGSGHRRGGGCGRCPRGRPRLAGWLSAPPRSGRVSGRPCGFPGRAVRRLSPPRSVLAALVFSPPSRRGHHPGHIASVCALVGDPWGRGGHCHTCPGGGGSSASGSSAWGATREQMARP